ncbi:MAG: Mov34/MPN/PAD-1 family protein [Clostridium perfringens]|nr:Mov34/MPN/PAD-1 family protein [Clostridium perfringens]MDU6313083.1 Mov34/MPN/PAD-1 family protein [Clostridium perfringens]
MELKYSIDEINLIITKDIIKRLSEFRQNNYNVPESGGLLLGRTDIHGNTKIIDITVPLEGDIQSRFKFIRKSNKHKELLFEAKKRCLYFKGNWHTHPVNVPEPSWVDIISWRNTLRKCKPGESRYAFFIIIGISEIRVWGGNIYTKEIKEAKIIR